MDLCYRKQERKVLVLFFNSRFWNFRGSKDTWPDDSIYCAADDVYFAHHSVLLQDSNKIQFCLDSLLSLVSLSLRLCVCQEKDLDNESVSLKQGKGNNKKTHTGDYVLLTSYDLKFQK